MSLPDLEMTALDGSPARLGDYGGKARLRGGVDMHRTAIASIAHLSAAAKQAGVDVVIDPHEAIIDSTAWGYIVHPEERKPNQNDLIVGTDRFQYTVTDVMNPPVTEYINVLTLPATTPTFDVREDVRVTSANVQMYISYSGLTANDYAPSAGPVTVTSVDTTGMLGTLTCDTFGCSYAPPFSYQRTTRFKYTVSDGHGGTDTATVKVRVGGTNTAPVAVADSFSTPTTFPWGNLAFTAWAHVS